MNTSIVKKPEDFVPDSQIHIDAEHSLEQLSGRFQNIKDGLPELIKNSKDHYSRVGVKSQEEKQIIVIVSNDKKNLGVLDFAGASYEDIERWKKWSSRTANQKNISEDIEGGYGNGGKSFMVRGCKIKSSMCGYTDGKINKRGFVNTDEALRFNAGIFKDQHGKEMKNIKDSRAEFLLDRELADFGLNVASLPQPARQVFKNRKAFTFISLYGIKSWEGLNETSLTRAIHRLSIDLMEHAQAALTLETCTVWVMFGSKLLDVEPLQVADLMPFEGLESVPQISIPEKIIDPETEEEVNLKFKNPEKNFLLIKTSRQNLRLSDRLKPRNVIRVRNSRNVVANWMLADLVPIGTSQFLYGYLNCEILDDSQHLAGSDRVSLAENPITRALKHWTSEKLTEIARELLRIQASRNKEEDVDSAAETLKKLRDLMREFLQNEIPDSDQGAEDAKGSKKSKTSSKKQKGNRVDEIVLESLGKVINMAEGSIIPLVVKCYQNENGEKIYVSNPHLILRADNDIFDWVDDTYIRGKSVGSANIFFETTNTRNKVKSNVIKVNVEEIKQVKVSLPERVLKQGETLPLDLTAINSQNKEIQEFIYEAHIDETEMGRVSRKGVFTAGGIEGFATVRIKYGLKEDQVLLFKIQIGNEKIEGGGGSSGNGVPYILLCQKEAPGTEDLPQESRTHIGGEDSPTIIDYEPQWRKLGIIWINHFSHESKKFRIRGNGETMKISSGTFQRFLALKCFEVLKRLKVEEAFKSESKNMFELEQALAVAEIEAAGFLEKAYLIVKDLISSEEENE
ncbi:MAG: hypothetical protein A3G04_01065 [Candidatus Taylorbacteria bacterium RIFCSPLOWO2_12_FULL_44_9]|nr:MAG: hypothetical protein A3G04_01065 [Candidatus Taylorbacteria bacterium RIFCSPLOWO2_12_FULL_44_9]